MKQLSNLLFIFLTFTQISFSQVRTVKDLDTNWKFQKISQEKAFEVNFDDSKWETVMVPHDWAI
jgi:beta-galactosidase